MESGEVNAKKIINMCETIYVIGYEVVTMVSEPLRSHGAFQEPCIIMDRQLNNIELTCTL
jgi:hypothetical protein